MQTFLLIIQAAPVEEATRLVDSDTAVMVRWAIWIILGLISLISLILAARQKHQDATIKVLNEELQARKLTEERLRAEKKEVVEAGDKKTELMHKLELELAEYKAKTDLTALSVQQQKNHDVVLSEMSKTNAALLAQGQLLASMAKSFERFLEQGG